VVALVRFEYIVLGRRSVVTMGLLYVSSLCEYPGKVLGVAVTRSSFHRIIVPRMSCIGMVTISMCSLVPYDMEY